MRLLVYGSGFSQLVRVFPLSFSSSTVTIPRCPHGWPRKNVPIYTLVLITQGPSPVRKIRRNMTATTLVCDQVHCLDQLIDNQTFRRKSQMTSVRPVPLAHLDHVPNVPGERTVRDHAVRVKEAKVFELQRQIEHDTVKLSDLVVQPAVVRVGDRVKHEVGVGVFLACCC